VSVDDVVAGHLAAARMGRIGERYILAGENRSFRQIFGIVAEETGGIAPLFTVPHPLAWTVAATIEECRCPQGASVDHARACLRNR